MNHDIVGRVERLAGWVSARPPLSWTIAFVNWGGRHVDRRPWLRRVLAGVIVVEVIAILL